MGMLFPLLPITLNVLEGSPNETAAPVLTPIVKTLVASTDVLLIVKPLEVTDVIVILSPAVTKISSVDKSLPLNLRFTLSPEATAS